MQQEQNPGYLLNNQPYDEKELLLRIAEGDEKAFSQVYQQHWESLFITAAKVLRSREEAADVIQDVFLSLWKRRGEMEIHGSMAAYLQTSVRYKAIHYIEKNITRRDYLSLLTELTIHQLPVSPELQLQLKELQAAFDTTIARMPGKMREVYLLSRRGQLTHKEIAEKLNISPETVKKHIQHAQQLIRSELGHTALSLAVLLSCLFP